ncbi:PREDICTED: syntaxin-3-like isoform X1 [Crocodylus porosus]|uniref:syntaxin-3-like isoform X1 n=2 Tax=Crocodylus porosus TaxID=8502 RepID=UPI00093AFB61|nr:PREDICTED: syntaxin-3-like isoform X1 [Crocodylus porosus]
MTPLGERGQIYFGLTPVDSREARCRQQLELKMKDRLEDLRIRVNNDRDSVDIDDAFSFDNPAFSEDETDPMSKIFQEVADLSQALNNLEELSETIDRKQQQVLCCTTEESISKEKKELSNITAAFTNDAQAIQPQLYAIQDTLARDSKQWLAGHRIRQSQLSVLISRYRDIVSRHYTKETQYVEKLKEQIMRQTELAGLSLHEEDINQLVKSPVGPRIVGQDLEILKAKQHMAMAHVRHQQLLDLEVQITELHSLFLHLNVLVSEQEEIVNNIEYNVMNTLDYISQSKDEVKKALKYDRSSRLTAVLSAVLGFCACCTCLSCVSGAVR